MKYWAIAFALLVIIGSIGSYVYTLRGYNPSRRHELAGALATFFMGFLLLVNQIFDPSLVKNDLAFVVQGVTEAIFLVAAIAFAVVEVRLRRRHRHEIIGK